jgi:transcription initiation factor IIE alpha subunit
MAEVPREAVEFARMAVRAFYPIEFAVIADGVLRNNNFCAHSTLAHVLRMKPKELRQILTRMVASRLMCCEKRQQKRINYKDEKRPSRVVNTEFWYVPLVELLDAFQFRVDIITKDLDMRIKKESELDRYQCQICKHRYKLVDICANFDPELNAFICDSMGPNRNICNGIVKEEDNRSVLKETESFKTKFEDELRPMRELATACNGMKIPAHPLEGADEETWALYVPETIGVHGEVVDEEGLTSEIAAEVNGRDPGADGVDSKLDGQIPMDAAGAEASGAIPERPDWFKEPNKDAEDMDDDWEEERDGVAGSSKPAFGTGHMFGESNVDAQSYLRSMLVPEISTTDTDRNGAGSNDADQRGVAATVNIEDGDERNLDKVDDVASRNVENLVVAVQGEVVPLSSVTEELIERMTAEEYESMCNNNPCLFQLCSALSLLISNPDPLYSVQIALEYVNVRQILNCDEDDDDDDDIDFE